MKRIAIVLVLALVVVGASFGCGKKAADNKAPEGNVGTNS